MIPPTPWLDHLTNHLPTARKGRDPEGVHQVRVAAGRLGVWLRLAGYDVLRDDVRWLRRHAAAVRDLDVLLADAPPAPWVPWLRRRRAAERRGLLEALDAGRLRGLLAAFAHLPPLEEVEAREGVRRLARDVLARAEALESHPSDLERMHDLRRSLRRLRYGIDWIGGEGKDLKRLQDAFGALNDLAVARRLVDAYRRRQVLAEWTAELDRRIDAARTGALGVWLEERGRVAALAG